jgi:asparagine synthase (glutamine-hydrolysing)
MCGIAGLLRLDGSGAPSRAALDVLLDAQVHRGPDGEGVFCDGPVALGSRRLALVDPLGGAQPLRSEDGAVTVVANGELYDDARERRALARAGHAFATGSDCEVLVHRYEDRGLGFTDDLRGMWGAAVWDARARRLVLARDPFGIKPLVYAVVGGTLVFASELGALLRLAEVPRDLDPDAVEELLAWGAVLGEKTIVQAVRRVPPGTLLVAGEDGVRLVRVGRPGPVAAGAVRRERAGALAAELRGRIRGSVVAHLRGDARVGVLLSGGLDSGLLCALAAEAAGPGVPTFTVGFPGAASFDERAGARRVARRYRTDHRELVVTAADAEAQLRSVAKAFDEPRADATALPYWLAGRAASAHVRVVLSGEGGDELFGGYQTYAADRLGGAGARAAALVAPLVGLAPSSSRRLPLDFRVRRLALGAGLDPVARHTAFKILLDARARTALGRPAASEPLQVHRARWAETAGAELVARLQDLDLGTFCGDDLLCQADRAGMAHGVEVRVPLLDREVAELAFALPVEHRVRGVATKRLLRRAAAPLLPPEVVRGPKRGFVAPTAAWLRGPLLPYARSVLAEGTHGLFDGGAALALLDRHVARREDLSRPLWGLMALALWHDAHLARPTSRRLQEVL